MKYIYGFSEGNKEMSALLSEKGANLSEMKRAGLPVPPGFIVNTEACSHFLKNGALPPFMEEDVKKHTAMLESETGKKLGRDMTVSVRYGARVSMPGVMESVLNVGFNDEVAKNLAKEGGEAFAQESYARFVRTFGIVILGIDQKKFTGKTAGAHIRTIKKQGKSFPREPEKQILECIKGIFASWNSPRAAEYRKSNNVKGDGTAAIVQFMAYGNLQNSGTGVCFSRNPSTGEKELYGEFISSTQGEDLVSGTVTPKSLGELKKLYPVAYRELASHAYNMERRYKDMQYMEFTVEKGRLYILETAQAKRTVQAAVRVAVELVKENVIGKKEAIMRINPYDVERMWHKRLDPNAKKIVVAKGARASPGAASGKAVFGVDKAIRLAGKGENVILVRKETSPEEIPALAAAQGILTASGGMTSHAAVIARGMGKPCVISADLNVDYGKARATIGNHVIKEGDTITIYGSTGEVILGSVPLTEPDASPYFVEMLSWCDDAAKLKVLANADTPEDAAKAAKLGAKGIGLCRTEHMFFGDRLPTMQKMILAETKEERERELKKMLSFQEKDFAGIFRAMKGRTVVIRLLDPPLHEFLPEATKDERTLRKINALKEKNPMMGTRGCRVGILYPEIFAMQARAIHDAAKSAECEVKIMVPFVSDWREMKRSREIISDVTGDAFAIGAMLELPRACLTADKIAEYADFFSFGTNDLTQTTFGFSRDDVEKKFFKEYMEQELMTENPFVSIDEEGVGTLMNIATEKTRGKELGICGEHGGDPKSVNFAHRLKLNYVSCSPYRVPVARLAAAQAAIRNFSPSNTKLIQTLLFPQRRKS